MITLPDGFEVGHAVGNRDCFFDSLAQGLKQLKPEFNFTVKSLRKVCREFAQKQSDGKSWLNAALESKNEELHVYIQRIKFTGTNVKKKSKLAKASGLTSPIWGRSDIEGRIICTKYNVKLHVVEEHNVEGKETYTHKLVDNEGSRSVDADVCYNEEDTVHIMNKGDMHFVPILRIIEVQRIDNKSASTNLNCSNNDKIAGRLLDIMMTNYSEEVMQNKITELFKEEHPEKYINNVKDVYDRTPLHLAVLKDYQKVMNLLLNYEINIEAQTIKGDTALHIAAERGCLPIVKNLLSVKSTLAGIKNHEGKFASELANNQNHAKVKNCIEEVENSTRKKNAKDTEGSESYVKNLQAGQTHGHSFEVELLMLFLLNGKEKIKKGEISHFILASDMNDAGGFDDAVFFYQDCSGLKKIIFLQAKHKEEEKVVSKRKLLSQSKTTVEAQNTNRANKNKKKKEKVFGLNKYFAEYMKVKKHFSKGDIRKYNKIFKEDDADRCFIIFTNALLTKKDGDNIKEYEVEQEHILNLGKTKTHYYTLTPDEETIQAILKDNTSHNKKDDTSHNKKDDTSHNKIDDTSHNKKDDTPYTKKDVEEFLSHLKLFFGQPNEKKLGEIIKEKIKSMYHVREQDVNQMFSCVQSEVQRWHALKKDNKSNFLTNDNKFFENAARLSMKFDVKEPVASFTGRTREFDDMHQILHETHEAFISRMVSVRGFDGVGKSELVREYIKNYSRDYEDNVIWINAENNFTMEECFLRVAKDMLEIQLLDDFGKRKEIIEIVKNVYHSFEKMERSCLFVFDNFGKHEPFGEKGEGIDKFLPSDGPNKPYIIITTCDHEWEKIKELRLDAFTEEEAVNYINKGLQNIGSNNLEVINLAKVLQFLPLALTQAVAYIQKENKRFNKWKEEENFDVNDYVDLFEGKLVELKGGSKKTPYSFTDTVMITCHIIIQKIKQERFEGGELALKILNYIAYVAPDEIPVAVDHVLSELKEDQEVWHNAAELLDEYWLAHLKGGKLTIHRLVQKVIRIELERWK